jgi:hypothetical protein
LGVWGFTPSHFLTLSHTPGSMWCDSQASSCLNSRASSWLNSRAFLWPAPLQFPFALVASPRLGLRHIPLKRKYLVCMLVPILRLVKSFSMKASRILSFTFFTFNIVWGKPERGGAPTSWLIRPPVINLPPTGYARCSMANLTIWTPIRTLCTL